jgi:plasmid stabilization system protein ParE
VAKVELAERIAADTRRIAAHLHEFESEAVEERLSMIFTALTVLEDNPLIGRRHEREWRELVIGKDASGYLALYRYQPIDDIVYVLAIRAQREAGYEVEIPLD